MESLPIALITVRSSSSRLPGKCFLNLGGQTVLEHVIRRAIYGGFEPIVCTSIQNEDNEIVKIASSVGVRSFQGDLENKILRWSTCMEKFDVSKAHLVDADDPFFDYDEMKKSYLLLDAPYDLVLTSKKSDNGFASVGTSVTKDYIATLCKRGNNLKSQNFDVIPWDLLINEGDLIYELPDNDYNFLNESDVRLTLDYPEDMELLTKISERFQYSEKRATIEKFLLDNPKIREINLFRNKDFIQNKKNSKIVEFG